VDIENNEYLSSYTIATIFQQPNLCFTDQASQKECELCVVRVRVRVRAIILNEQFELCVA